MKRMVEIEIFELEDLSEKSKQYAYEEWIKKQPENTPVDMEAFIQKNRIFSLYFEDGRRYN